MARRKKYNVSKVEGNVLILLKKHGYNVIPQFKIPGIPFIYDFYLPDLKIFIEYQGDYYHCNPLKYKSGSLIQMVGYKDKILVDHIWDKDSFKARVADKYGYKVVYVWEKDFKRDGWEAIEKVLFQ